MAISRKSKRAYLSGGMEYARNEGADWRAEMHDWLRSRLGHRVFNPNLESRHFLARRLPGVDLRALKSDDIDRYIRTVAEIVDRDSAEIARRSDYVICLWDRSAARGAGTKGELTVAKYFGKPVYVVSRIAPENIPGWVLGCTTRLFRSWKELREFLTHTFGHRDASKR